MKYSSVLSVLVMCCLVSTISGQVVSTGLCRTPNIVTDFRIADFAGLWFEIYATNQPYEENLECITTSLTQDGNNYAVLTRGVSEGEATELEGRLSKEDESNNEARFTLSYPEVENLEPTSYWITRTDYTGYAVVYACTQVDEETRSESAWVLGRDTYLPAAGLDLVYNEVSTIIGWDNVNSVSHAPDSCEDGAATTTLALSLLVISLLVSRFM